MSSTSPELGPSDAFLHVRVVDGRRVVDGVETWTGGTRVEHGRRRHGVWASWEWDGERVRVSIDPRAFFPLYYFASEREICVAPNLLTLLERGAPRALDDDAIGIFLRLGTFLGDDTAFRAIRSVPASSRFEWHDGRLEVARTRWRPTEVALTREEAVDRYVEVFRQAMERRLVAEEEAFDLPMSGGVDSRHILLELLRAGRCPRALVTAPQQLRSTDVEIASRIAQRTGIQHVVVHGMLDDGWRAELRKNRTTNFCADEHVWYLPVADRLAATTRTTYDGVGGDILSAQLVLPEPVVEAMRAHRVDEIVDDVMTRVPERVLQHAVTPSFYARIPPANARDRITEEMRALLDMPNAWSMFFFLGGSRREISLTPHATLAPLTVHTPFLDDDLVDLLAGLPPELQLGGALHAETVARAFPEWRGVPYGRELPPPAPVTQLALKAARLPAHAALHVRAHAVGPPSALLRRVPPVLEHPATPGTLGRFNRRAVWLRQLEVLVSAA